MLDKLQNSLRSLFAIKSHPRRQSMDGLINQRITTLGQLVTERLEDRRSLLTNSRNYFFLNPRLGLLSSLHQAPKRKITTRKGRVTKKETELRDFLNKFLSTTQSGQTHPGNTLQELIGIMLLDRIIDIALPHKQANEISAKANRIQDYAVDLLTKYNIGIQMVFERLDSLAAIEPSNETVTVHDENIIKIADTLKVLAIAAKQGKLTLNGSRLDSLEEALIQVTRSLEKDPSVRNILDPMLLFEIILQDSNGTKHFTDNHTTLLDLLSESSEDTIRVILENSTLIYPHQKLLEKFGDFLYESFFWGPPTLPHHYLHILGNFDFKSYDPIPDKILNILANLMKGREPGDSRIKNKEAARLLKATALVTIFNLPNINTQIADSLKEAFEQAKSDEEKDIIRSVAKKHNVTIEGHYLTESELSIHDLQAIKFSPNDNIETLKALRGLLLSRADLSARILCGKITSQELNQILKFQLDCLSSFNTKDPSIAKLKFFELLADIFMNFLDQEDDDYQKLHQYIDPLIREADPLLLKIFLERCFEDSHTFEQEAGGMVDSKPIDFLNYICQFQELTARFANTFSSYFEDPENRNRTNSFLSNAFKTYRKKDYKYCKEFLETQLKSKF